MMNGGFYGISSQKMVDSNLNTDGPMVLPNKILGFSHQQEGDTNWMGSTTSLFAVHIYIQ